MIKLAEMTDLEKVLQITHDTISEIYSHYYAEGVVQFFLEHHSRENVLSDIEDGIVWLMEEEDGMIGTVTVKGNAVNRLFVLPEYQSHGYGSQLMDFAERNFQENDLFWAEYSGGDVLKGHMIGIVGENGELDFHYQHLNKDRQIRIGKCHSIPDIMENGKIALQEKWQWLNGDLSGGESVVVEK